MSQSLETTPVRKTALNAAHRALGAKLVPFAGWEMPLHYGSALEEHVATRRACGVFDVSHMGQFAAIGPQATELVQAIVSRDISKLEIGQQAYAVLCNDAGGLVDDLIAARLGSDIWLMVVNAATRAGDLARMQEVARMSGPVEADLDDQSERWAMIAVQGPQWRDICRRVFGPGDWEELEPFRIADLTFEETHVIISTTGYTGERGVELLCRPDSAPTLWGVLVSEGARPVGLAARDSLRLEMGYRLSGQDFTEADNPFEAGLGWVVDLGKGEFSGGAALRQLHAAGPARRMVGLLPEGRRIPRHGAAIVAADGKPIGVVTSGGWSPTLERPIAMGYVATNRASRGERVAIDLGGGRTTDAEIARMPFVKNK
jgi:aminomethyltransferase